MINRLHCQASVGHQIPIIHIPIVFFNGVIVDVKSIPTYTFTTSVHSANTGDANATVEANAAAIIPNFFIIIIPSSSFCFLMKM